MNVYRRLLRILKHRGEDLLLFEIIVRGINVAIGALVAFVVSAVIGLKTGQSAINANFLSWIDGTYIVVLSLSVFVLLFFAVLEIVGLVHITHSYENGERPSILQTTKFAFRKALGLLHAYGLTSILVIFFAFIMFPILKIGPTVFRSFSIPSFITNELLVTRTADVIYWSIVAVLLFVIYRSIFIFHIYATRAISLFGALKASWIITSKKKSIHELLAWGVIAPTILCIVLVTVTALVAIVLVSLTNGLVLILASSLPQNILILFYAAWMFIITALISVSVAPFLISTLTAFLEVRSPAALGGESIKHHTDDLHFFKNKFFVWLFRTKKNILVFGILVFFAFALVAKVYINIFEVAAAEPVVFAHRGLTEGSIKPKYTENTINSFRESIEQGATGIETDIQRLKDGTAIFFHDPTVRKYGIEDQLTNLTYADLINTGAEVSKLGELALFPEFNCSTTWLLEIKNYKSISADSSFDELAIATEINSILKEKNMYKCVYVGSFDVATLLMIKSNYPDIKTNLYIYNTVGNIERQIDTSHIDAISIEESLKTNRIVRSYLNAEKPVFIWTVNDVNTVQGLKQLGVSGIITDYPAQVLSKLDQTRGERQVDTTRVIELFGKTFVLDLGDIWQFKFRYAI